MERGGLERAIALWDHYHIVGAWKDHFTAIIVEGYGVMSSENLYHLQEILSWSLGRRDCNWTSGRPPRKTRARLKPGPPRTSPSRNYECSETNEGGEGGFFRLLENETGSGFVVLTPRYL